MEQLFFALCNAILERNFKTSELAETSITLACSLMQHSNGIPGSFLITLTMSVGSRKVSI